MASRAIGIGIAGTLAPPRRALAEAWLDAGLMLAAALLLRCWWFGDPAVQVDEQFYLLAGDRMLHDAVPFLDIWDRKPIGLFIVYAATRLLGGGGIVEYQLVAAGLAALAAFFVVRIARRIASPSAARLAGVAALLWLLVFDGAGGQAPIFYNWLVAFAALFVVRAVAERRASFVRDGQVAMGLIGLAIQIKYTVLFEGVALGCVLLWHAYRSGMRPLRLAASAGSWVVLALAPTALAWALFAWRGHGAEFAFANFVSIGLRPATAPAIVGKRLLIVLAYAAPLLLAAGVGLRQRLEDDTARRARAVLVVWLIGAGIGFLAIGSFYKHYFLPAVIPLAVAAAPALEQRFRAFALLVIGAAVALQTGLHRASVRGGRQTVAALTGAIRPYLTDRLYVFDGEPILYFTTGAQLASRFAFPNHLNEAKEAPAIGIDPSAEVRRVLTSRPSVIVSSNRPDKDANRATWAIMGQGLAADYRPVAFVPVHRRVRIVYVLKRQPVRKITLMTAMQSPRNSKVSPAEMRISTSATP